MKNFKKTTMATAASLLLVSGAVSAADIYLDVGTNAYEVPLVTANDADSTTGIFEQFGFNQLLATSIYDINEVGESGGAADIFGSFYDTNIASELTAAGVPTSGTAMDGSTFVELMLPGCPGTKCDIDALSPLVPPSNGVDSEGYGLTWDLQLQYRFEGTLTLAGPVYTGGYIDVNFNDFNDNANDRTVITGSLTGSLLEPANLNLYFDITFAEVGFLFIDNGSGTFIDAAEGTTSHMDNATFAIDTNVVPPIPTLDQLLVVGDNAIRQSELDGSAVAAIPEPATIAMMGLGLLGLGAAARRRNTKA